MIIDIVMTHIDQLITLYFPHYFFVPQIEKDCYHCCSFFFLFVTPVFFFMLSYCYFWHDIFLTPLISLTILLQIL
ncbi:unnamed protein product [Rotaria socialis]